MSARRLSQQETTLCLSTVKQLFAKYRRTFPDAFRSYGRKAELCRRLIVALAAVRGAPVARRAIAQQPKVEKELKQTLQTCRVQSSKCATCVEKLKDYIIKCNASKKGCTELKHSLMDCLQLSSGQANSVVNKLLVAATAKVVQSVPPPPIPPPPPAITLIAATGKRPVAPPVRKPSVAALPAPTEQKRMGLLEQLKLGRQLKKAKVPSRKATARRPGGVLGAIEAAMQKRRKDIAVGGDVDFDEGDWD